MKKFVKSKIGKPLFCDSGMCESCNYIGDGDFVCNEFPNPVLVVKEWHPTEASGKCPKLNRKAGIKNGQR